MRTRTLINGILANRDVPATDVINPQGGEGAVYGTFQVNNIAPNPATVTLYGRLDARMPWYQINTYVSKADAERVTLFPEMYCKITGWANDTVTFTNATDHCDFTAHGMVTGDGPFQFEGSDIPDGLIVLTDYFCILVDADNFKMALTRELAFAGTVVPLADDGSGTTKLNGVIDAVLSE